MVEEIINGVNMAARQEYRDYKILLNCVRKLMKNE